MYSVTVVASNMNAVDVVTTDSLTTNSTIIVILPISLVFVFTLLIIIVVVCISFLIYKRRQSRHLSNLTKPHKESEENSYASSVHSCEFSSKQSDSPGPGYDVIKMGDLKEVDLKSTQLDNNSKFVLSSKDIPFKDEHLDSDLLYSTISSGGDDVHKIAGSDIDLPFPGKYHKIDCYRSADNNPSNNIGNEKKEEVEGVEHDDETNKPHTYSVVHSTTHQKHDLTR